MQNYINSNCGNVKHTLVCLILHEPHLSKATVIDGEGSKIATVPQISNKLLISIFSDHAYRINYLRPSLLTWHLLLSVPLCYLKFDLLLNIFKGVKVLGSNPGYYILL